jgi:hypothetical protein
MEKIKIEFKDFFDISRLKEPVSFGIPFSAGVLKDVADISFEDMRGVFMTHGAIVMARWHDRSVKWLLVDLQVSVFAGEKTSVMLIKRSSLDESGKTEEAFEQISKPLSDQLSGTLLDISGSLDDELIVNTGVTEFRLTNNGPHLFNKLLYAGDSLITSEDSGLFMIDGGGKKWIPAIHSWGIEHDTALRKVIVLKGCFQNSGGEHPMQFTCLLHFFAGHSFVKMEWTIHNPEPACHPGGVWDLGDKNSCFFKELALFFAVKRDPEHNDFYIANILDPLIEPSRVSDCSNLTIYQDSSGGDNWRSKIHVNAQGGTPLSFKGYRVLGDGETLHEGLRATPLMGISSKAGTLCGFVSNFWQNFPKAMEISKDGMKISLFPGQFNDLYELQPGEQKTHTVYVGVETPFQQQGSSLRWASAPLVPDFEPDYLYGTSALPRSVPVDRTAGVEACDRYQDLVDQAIKDSHSFVKKREIIDEYGWRNFGDLYADHEAVFSKGEDLFISHYNNQYDVIKGALIQYQRTGKRDWFVLAKEMGDHVVDIDIYHTDKDKYQFNNGMFWHTDHHLDAETATHRTVSERHRAHKPPGTLGGGPAPDHNYVTGLLYLYYLTGDSRYKEAVVALGSNIISLIDGPDTLCESGVQWLRGVLNNFKTRGNSVAERYNEVFNFDGPGRASGNALNTLLDAWLATYDDLYMHYAENLMLMSVSPDDDFNKMDLLNAELRWMYTIFLLALGRYLGIKEGADQKDGYYTYGKTVLLHYARWMAENEYPYLNKPEILEFPNETWPAQDIRKSDIFAYAARIAPEGDKELFVEKSRFFFQQSVDQLSRFEDTRHFTRPLAIMMTNGMVHMEMQCMGENFFKTLECDDKMHHLPTPPLRSFDEGIFQRISLKNEVKWIQIQIRARIGQ